MLPQVLWLPTDVKVPKSALASDILGIGLLGLAAYAFVRACVCVCVCPTLFRKAEQCHAHVA